MICYQTRYEDGVFLGIAQAYPDPREPDRIVLPGACVSVAPPAFEAGKQARWFDGKWIIEPVSFFFSDVITNPKQPIGIAISWDGDTLITEKIYSPELTEGQTAKWNGAAWEVTDPPPPPPPPPPPILSPAEKLQMIGLTVGELKELLSSGK